MTLEMTPEAFVARVAPVVEAIHRAESRLFPEVLAAQFADETGWGRDGLAIHNYAGISKNGRVLAFPDDAAFVAVYLRTIRLPWYASVLAAQTPEEQAVALGLSPWARLHYALDGRPGGTLLAIMQEHAALFASAFGTDQEAAHEAEPETAPADEPKPSAPAVEQPAQAVPAGPEWDMAVTLPNWPQHIVVEVAGEHRVYEPV